MVKTATPKPIEAPIGITTAELLGLKPYQPIKLHEQLLLGLPYKALERFVTATGLPDVDVNAVLRTPPRTLARRKSASLLSPEESDHLVRLATLYSQALQLFHGNVTATTDWLGQKRPALAGHRPIDLARTSTGTQQVADLIFQLEDGIIV